MYKRQPVDFTEDKSPESLKEEINSFIKSTDKKIYVFTDLVGGTPFKVSSELTLESVSYTHLDVYKRQVQMYLVDKNKDFQ